MYGDELRVCRDMQLAIMGHILIEQYGKEALDALMTWNNERTRTRWREIAKSTGRRDPEYLFRLFNTKAHVFTIIRKNETALEVQVTKCIHADTFKKLNAMHIGEKLICSGDVSATKGFNPAIRFERPQVLMRGDDCCHFIWELPSEQHQTPLEGANES
jgi:hypothetical protein